MAYDWLTNEEVDDEELAYREQLRNSMVSGELKGAPNDDNTWQLEPPAPTGSTRNLHQGVPKEDAELPTRKVEKKTQPAEDENVFPTGKTATPSQKPRPASPNPGKDETNHIGGFKSEDPNADMGLPDQAQKVEQANQVFISQVRAGLTGVNDAEVNGKIFDQWTKNGLDWKSQKTLAQHLKYKLSEGVSIDEAWQWLFTPDANGHSMAREALSGNVSAPERFNLDVFALNSPLDALKILDPVSTFGRFGMGEKDYDALPAGVKTFAEWIPIIAMPAKGLLKDLVIGGMGPKLGLVAATGAAATSQAQESLGVPKAPLPIIGMDALQFASAIVAPTAMARTRFLRVSDAMLNGEKAALDDAIQRSTQDISADLNGQLAKYFATPTESADMRLQIAGNIEQLRTELDNATVNPVAQELRDEFVAVKDAKPDELVTVYHGTDEKSALDIDKNGFHKGGFLTTDPEAAKLHAIEKWGVEDPQVIAFQVPRKLLTQSKANPIVFQANSTLQQAANEVRHGYVPNVGEYIRNWLAGARLNPELGAVQIGRGITESAQANPWAATDYSPVSAEKFHQFIVEAGQVEKNGRLVSETITTYTVEEYGKMKTFLSPDGKTGFALKPGIPGDPDVDLVSVFNVGKPGGGSTAVERALIEGANKLDAFDENGFLPNLYSKFGFVERGRDAWDEQYKPPNWSGGTPEVVYMDISTEKLQAFYNNVIENLGNSQEVLDGMGRNVAPEKLNMYLKARENLMRGMGDALDLGTEISTRTDGTNGMASKTMRAIRQYLAEQEGAIRSIDFSAPWSIVRNFLKNGEEGVFRMPGFLDEEPLDPAVAALIGVKDTTEELSARMQVALDPSKAVTDSVDDVIKQYYDNQSLIYKAQKAGEPLEALEKEKERLSKILDDPDSFISNRPLRDQTGVLEEQSANLAKWDEKGLRESYRRSLEDAARAQANYDQELEAGLYGTETPAEVKQHEIASMDDMRENRAEIYRALADAQMWGEELYKRTDGNEGMLPKIGKAFKQVLQGGEEGFIRMPNLVTPNANIYKVTHKPAPETVRLTGVGPIQPHLTKFERLLNNLKAVTPGLFHELKMEGMADPLAARIASEDIKALQMLDRKRVTARSQMVYNFKTHFKVDENAFVLDQAGKSMDLTVQDIAADWQAYRPILTPGQNVALGRMRDMMEQYWKAWDEQGIKRDNRPDIQPGGFYMPRGSTLDDSLDYEAFGVVAPQKRSPKISQQRTAKWDSMSEGIKGGETYIPFENAIDVYLRNAGQLVLDTHWANVLRTATDESGDLLSSTAAARLLQQNKPLARQMGQLKYRVNSLSKSIEGLNNREKGILLKFANSPAPDLQELMNAINTMSTKGGSLRVRPMFSFPSYDIGANFKIARRMVKNDVFRARGRFAGMTAEAADKILVQEHLDATKIRRGQFKGMTMVQGITELERIKNQVNALMPKWQEAKDFAAKNPSGTDTIAMKRFGLQLQGVAFEESLYTGLNHYLNPRDRFNFPLFTAATNVMRGLRSTMDFSYMGNQLLLAGPEGMRDYAKSVGASFRSLKDTQTFGRFLDKFDLDAANTKLPTSMDWMSTPLHVGGSETEFSIGGTGRSLAGKNAFNKLFDPFNRAFGVAGDAMRLSFAQSHFSDWLEAHPQATMLQRKQAMNEIGSAANGLTGYSARKLGGNVGSALLFAPRFYMAQFETVARSLDPRGATVMGIKVLPGETRMSAVIARRSLIKLLGMGAAFTAAANIALGNEPDGKFNWWSPMENGRINRNFMRIRAGSMDISVFGYMDSLVYGMIGAATDDPVFLARSRANPVMGTLVDIISKKNAIGEDMTDPLNIARSFLPFSVQKIGKEPLAKTAFGTTGLKASELSTSEKRTEVRDQTINDMIKDGTIPANMIAPFKQTPYENLPSGMQKLVDRELGKRYPESAAEFTKARQDSGSVYQKTSDAIDVVRAEYATVYDDLFKQLLAGENPKTVWEAYDDKMNQMRGGMKNVYDNAEYQKAIGELAPTDMRKLENDYNAISAQVFTSKNGALTNEDYDAIEIEQEKFKSELRYAHPDVYRQFEYSQALKEQFSLEDANPMERLRKDSQAKLEPYYELLKENPDDSDIGARWLNANPEADFFHWMTNSSADSPTLNSVAGLEQAVKMAPNREKRLAGTTLLVNDENLPTLKQYDKEITRLLTLPGSAEVNGKKVYPVQQLREQNPLYDALYYWLGFAKPAKGETAVTVYHPDAVLEYLKIWGYRTDSEVNMKRAK